MKREKLFQDKKTMPRINQAVAKRFVLHGIQKARKNLENEDDNSEETDTGHVNKKRRIE